MHKKWCGKPCAECESPCSLDESMPCSPDCLYLGANGETDSAECKSCDALIDREYEELLWNCLLKHRGHNVSIVSYGDPSNPADVCLECEDCGEVVLDAEIYTLCAREDV